MKDTKDETFVALWPLFYSLKLFNNLETCRSYKTTINLENTKFLGKNWLPNLLFAYLLKNVQIFTNTPTSAPQCMPQIPLSSNRLELSPCSFNPRTQTGSPDGYNHFFSEDTPRDSGPSPPPFLYDVDNEDDLSFDIMSSEFAFCIIMSDSLFQMSFISNSSPTEKMAGFAP